VKAVLQRVASASVVVDGDEVGSIAAGILALLGVERGDDDGDAAWMVRKIAEIRMFEDEAGKMNRSVEDIGGRVLVVSQFTLCADCRKGRRPGFGKAADPEVAEGRVGRVVEGLRGRGLAVATGRFGARMEVSLVNAGPVTFLLYSPGANPKGGAA
jgi:D-tyrosyl-tRNA(Tyr) deacylase